MANGYGGGANGGCGSGMPGGSPPGKGFAGQGGSSFFRSRGGRKAPTSQVTKKVEYVANGTNSSKIMSFSQTANTVSGDGQATAVNESIPSFVSIQNTGSIPVVAMFGYESYSDEDSDGGTKYLHTMILPGDSVQPPTRGVMPTADELHLLDGEVVDFTAPNTSLYTDSGANVDTNDLNNTTTPITIGLDSAASVNFFRVNDIIRVSDDVMRVLGTYSDDPTGSSLAAPQIRVERGLYGSAVGATA